MGRAYDDGMELVMFAAQSEDIARQLRGLCDSGLCALQIDDEATRRAVDGIAVNKLTEPYQLLLDHARALHAKSLGLPLVPHASPSLATTGA